MAAASGPTNHHHEQSAEAGPSYPRYPQPTSPQEYGGYVPMVYYQPHLRGHENGEYDPTVYPGYPLYHDGSQPMYDSRHHFYRPPPSTVPALHAHAYGPTTPTPTSPYARYMTQSSTSPQSALPVQLSMARPESSLEPTASLRDEESHNPEFPTFDDKDPPPDWEGDAFKDEADHNTDSSVVSAPRYIISSWRPSDPTRLHVGFIISPSARPPAHIVSAALPYSSPSPSPPPQEPKSPGDAGVSAARDNLPPSSDTSTTETVTAFETTVPTSPISTNTSLSTPPSAAPKIRHLEAPAGHDLGIKLEEQMNNPPTIVSSQPAVPIAEVKAPSVGQSAPKKSWASLLRATDGSATSSSLPTSSVVGFSIAASELHNDAPATRAVPQALIDLLTVGKISSNEPMPRIRPRGLINTGNMCFANAVLQVLVYCIPFHRLFKQLGKYLKMGIAGTQGKEPPTPLIFSVVDLLQEFQPIPPRDQRNDGSVASDDEFELDSFIPSLVYEAMKEKKRFDAMRGGHQEDAEEFLGFFLDTLEEELKVMLSIVSPNTLPKTSPQPAPAQDGGWMEVGKRNRFVVTHNTSSASSPITHLFGGKFRSLLRSPGQKDSAMLEDWRSLQLDIQPSNVSTIEDAIQNLSTPQTVEVKSVTRGGVTVNATQQVHFEALPPILHLHLKRFLYDPNAGGVVKVGKQISFGPELEISTGMMSATLRASRPANYVLYGVIYHHGSSALGGHYTIDVLHPNRQTDSFGRSRESWIRIDDELVSDLRPGDVFETPDPKDDRCAYLLCYRRVTPYSKL